MTETNPYEIALAAMGGLDIIEPPNPYEPVRERERPSFPCPHRGTPGHRRCR